MLPNAKQLACLSVGGSFVRRPCEGSGRSMWVGSARSMIIGREGGTDAACLEGQEGFFKAERKKERKQTKPGGMGGRHAATTQLTGILRRECGASLRPPSGVYLFLSLVAVSRQFSQRPSCHLSFFPLSSSFSLLLFLILCDSSLSSASF